MASKTREHPLSLLHELQNFIGSLFPIVLVEVPTSREDDQVCSWHIANNSVIHDLKSDM